MSLRKLHPNTSPQFHAEDLSSAHIYLRLKTGEAWDEIPQEVVIDCAQLTKANSIEGNKKNNVTIIYTPWSNLEKNDFMEVGQVGFKDPQKVKRVLVKTRVNAIVNRLNKTKEEKRPDLAKEKEDMEREKRQKKRQLELERVSRPNPLTFDRTQCRSGSLIRCFPFIEKGRSKSGE